MNDQTSAKTPTLKYAGLFRRLLAIFYDCFLLCAILLVFAAIAMTINKGKAIEASDSFRPLYAIFMFSVCYFYFAWFWIHGGQSLGMKTWRIQLRRDNHEQTSAGHINWSVASMRFFSAIFSWGFFGLGFIWALLDKKNRCWHDLSSKTVLIDLRTKE